MATDEYGWRWIKQRFCETNLVGSYFQIVMECEPAALPLSSRLIRWVGGRGGKLGARGMDRRRMAAL
jgi:hypothetical protein